MPVYVKAIAAEIEITPVIRKMYGGFRSDFRPGVITMSVVAILRQLRFSH